MGSLFGAEEESAVAPPAPRVLLLPTSLATSTAPRVGQDFPILIPPAPSFCLSSLVSTSVFLAEPQASRPALIPAAAKVLLRRTIPMAALVFPAEESASLAAATAVNMIPSTPTFSVVSSMDCLPELAQHHPTTSRSNWSRRLLRMPTTTQASASLGAVIRLPEIMATSPFVVEPTAFALTQLLIKSYDWPMQKQK